MTVHMTLFAAVAQSGILSSVSTSPTSTRVVRGIDPVPSGAASSLLAIICESFPRYRLSHVVCSGGLANTSITRSAPGKTSPRMMPMITSHGSVGAQAVGARFTNNPPAAIGPTIAYSRAPIALIGHRRRPPDARSGAGCRQHALFRNRASSRIHAGSASFLRSVYHLERLGSSGHPLSCSQQPDDRPEWLNDVSGAIRIRMTDHHNFGGWQ